jgi:xylan 1,4-beta-xylosidase
MGPVVTAHRTYNFTLLERLWRSQVLMGLHPVVELSFMPSFLGNCSWSVKATDCHASSGLPCQTDFGGGKRCQAGMAYQGVTQLPTNFDDWRHLVQSAIQMAVDKFGLEEVQQWRFEVWNELWGMAGDLPGKTSPSCTKPPCIGSVYMALYNASAVGVKSVHESLQVGGPATEHLNTEHFLSQAEEMGAPVDFVSTHNYPTGPRNDGSGCPQGNEWRPQCFVERVMAARAETPDKPFMLTEYSVMVGEGMAKQDQWSPLGATNQGSRAGEPPFQHDGPGSAAFVFRMVPQLAPHLDALSYWTFSGE